MFPVVLLTVACDPGASFRLTAGDGTRVSWAIAGDSVRGRVRASAFTIGLSIEGELEAPTNVTVTLDSTNLVIHDVEGISLRLAQFSRACQDTLPVPPLQSRHCFFGYADLQSTNYDRLDSISVQFGYATAKDTRAPLVAAFVRVR